MASLIYGSSQTDPNYANFQGSLTYAPKSVTAQIPYQTSGPGVVQGFSGVSAPSGGGGGGGGGGSSGLDPHINPATGVWDDNYFASQSNAIQAQADAELQAALGALDYERGNLEAQQGQLGTQRTSALSEIEKARGKSSEQAQKSTSEAERSTMQSKSKALSTAQDVQKSNRNVLRALGILSSSAAGEMLGKPINEYAKQAADLQQSLVTRKGDIDTWLRDRMEEAQKAVTDIETQYGNMTSQIQRDLRFNDRQRTDAIRQVTAALQTRIAEVQKQAQAYQMTAQQYNNSILQQVAQLQMYQNPQADTSRIQGMMLSSMFPSSYSPQQVGVQQEDPRKKLLSGLGR